MGGLPKPRPGCSGIDGYIFDWCWSVYSVSVVPRSSRCVEHIHALFGVYLKFKTNYRHTADRVDRRRCRRRERDPDYTVSLCFSFLNTSVVAILFLYRKVVQQ